MQKEPKLWERKGRGWFVSLGRKQVCLGKDEAEARKEYHRVLASEGFVPPAKDVTLETIIGVFLDHSEKTNKPKTFVWHKFFLGSFTKKYGKLKVRELKRLHLTSWTQEKRKRPWGQNTIRHALSCVRACLRFAVSEGYIKAEPITFKLPPSVRREKVLTPAEIAFLFEHAGRGGFREILTALIESGARPGEVCAIEAQHVDLEKGIWKLPDHKTRGKTGKPRIIYLTPTLLELSRRLCERYPEGKLFRNSWGNPWSVDNIRERFNRLKAKGLASDAVPYCLRHGFITNALENGVPIATVSELVGHADCRMVSSVYSHLSERTEHLRKAVEQATKK